MYYDGMVLKSVLESFVDDIAEESSELLPERPRYAYAVVVVADDHEICEVKEIFTREVLVMLYFLFRDNAPYDSDIQRALQELIESRDLLVTPRQSMLVDTSKYEVGYDHSKKAAVISYQFYCCYCPLASQVTSEVPFSGPFLALR
ncbi:unnamed protein product [Angiostrongylus costaricensis]|uniref:DUF5085 family protein n=1 Tax=Angiostrongylus costaricensis TaxID=334426 RepID=A0A0R3PPZ5_ANGCS|nr:unnamed protein product [Angiostrongylus costaricensis]